MKTGRNSETKSLPVAYRNRDVMAGTKEKRGGGVRELIRCFNQNPARPPSRRVLRLETRTQITIPICVKGKDT